MRIPCHIVKGFPLMHKRIRGFCLGLSALFLYIVADAASGDFPYPVDLEASDLSRFQ